MAHPSSSVRRKQEVIERLVKWFFLVNIVLAVFVGVYAYVALR